MVPIKTVLDFEEWFKTLGVRDQAMILTDFANELYPAFIINVLHDQMVNSNKKEMPNIRVDLVNNVKSSWHHSFMGCAIPERQLKFAADFQSRTRLP